MTESSQMPRVSSEFDDFLFVPIGEDRHGMALNLLSVLARSDLDPWAEAARLSELPEKYAKARVAALIAALPSRPLIPAGCGGAAAQAVARLPRRTTPTVELPKAPRRFALPEHSWAIVCAVLMVLAVGALWAAESHQAAAKEHHHVVSAPTHVSSAKPPADTGK